MAPSTSPRPHQMMQIGARVLRRGACALRIERARVLGIARVAQIEPPAPGEGLAVAARAGRHHAVEHVDAAGDRCEQILRRADAHQIARPILRQHGSGRLDHVEHRGLPFADRQPADGIAVEADSRSARRRIARADRDRRCPARCRTGPGRARPSFEMPPWSARPAERQLDARLAPHRASPDNGVHSSSTIWMSEPSRHCTSMARSGVSAMRGAVDMRLEGDALLRRCGGASPAT